jgi:hypothetical protein
MRKWLYLAPVILLAACSRSGSNPSVAQTAGPAGNPEPVAEAPAPVPEPGKPSPTQPLPSNTAAPDPAAPSPLVIPQGTVVRVRLDEAVDTRRNRAGDGVTATLYEPIVIDGQAVVPAGTRFAGHVTVADASGRLKGRAHIGVALDSFELQGRRYRVTTTDVERASNAHKKRNGILIGGAAGLGTLLGAIAGGPKGALIGAGAGAAAGTAGAAATGKLQVGIPAETILRFTLRRPVEV